MDKLMKAYLSVSVIGVADSIYHSYESVTFYHASWCDINSIFSCGGALASRYSHLFGIPLYAFGLFWFPLTLILGVWSQRTSGALDAGILIPVLMIGNIFTLYLWYIDLAVIHVICLVCISLYVLNYALTAVTFAAALR